MVQVFSMTRILTIIAILFATPAWAEETKSVKTAKLSKNIHATFECIFLHAEAFERNEENSKMVGAAMERAMKQGHQFFEALKSNEIKREDLRAHVPMYWFGVFSRMPTDFQLGQIFESSFDKSKELGDYFSWKQNAQRIYQEKNCDLILSR